MKFLNSEKLNALTREMFLSQKPYPWLNPENLLTSEGYNSLISNTPPIELFTASFGVKRQYGQKSHDRYVLTYKEGIKIPKVWQEFIDELNGEEYGNFIKRLYGVKNFNLQFEWHYSKAGNSVSPHCDGDRKIGTHIFYLNTKDNWQEKWGGQTLVLVDKKGRNEYSAPLLSEFEEVITPKALGNMSFIFAKTKNSWHAVAELNSPPEAIRKIFNITIDSVPSLGKKIVTKVRELFR